MSTYTQKQTNEGDNKSWIAIIAVVILFAVAALVYTQFQATNVNQPNGNTNQSTPPTTLSAGMDVWQAADVDSYSYDLQVSCFCLTEFVRPVNIVVENGEVASVTYTDDGTAADAGIFERHSTVEALFERLEEAQAQNPATFDVTFDEQYGVPQTVNIDISEQMADEEIRFTVSNFVVNN